MGRPIDLNHERVLTANEIPEKRPYRLLPNEFVPVQPSAPELFPKAFFGKSLVFPQGPAANRFV
jgi:hypothetical protein